MIRVYRVCDKRVQKNAFIGEGSKLHGGRWNHKGTALVYTGDSLALSAMELFVHLGYGGSKADYVYFSLDIPKSLKITRLSHNKLPKGWNGHPIPDANKDIGTNWALSRQSSVLVVPCAVVPDGNNYILNPDHPDFKRISISNPLPFLFDFRMWNKLSPAALKALNIP